MATAFDDALFEDDWESVRRLPEADRWILERDGSVPLGIFATLSPRVAPQESFTARLRWTEMGRPPSLKFVDPSTRSDTLPRAWPRFFGARPSNLDACLPWTQEGQTLHPEWERSASTRYPAVDVPIQFALLHLQTALDNTYAGREA
jgi:hypothetical protein